MDPNLYTPEPIRGYYYGWFTAYPPWATYNKESGNWGGSGTPFLHKFIKCTATINSPLDKNPFSPISHNLHNSPNYSLGSLVVINIYLALPPYIIYWPSDTELK